MWDAKFCNAECGMRNAGNPLSAEWNCVRPSVIRPRKVNVHQVERRIQEAG